MYTYLLTLVCKKCLWVSYCICKVWCLFLSFSWMYYKNIHGPSPSYHFIFFPSSLPFPRCLLQLVLLGNLGFFLSQRFLTLNLSWLMPGKWFTLLKSSWLHSQAHGYWTLHEAPSVDTGLWLMCYIWFRNNECWLWTTVFPTELEGKRRWKSQESPHLHL